MEKVVFVVTVAHKGMTARHAVVVAAIYHGMTQIKFLFQLFNPFRIAAVILVLHFNVLAVSKESGKCGRNEF